MARRSLIIAGEAVPLDEARRMSRGRRMNPELYRALMEKIESLDNTATRLPIPEGTRPATMKHRILRIAAELSISVTVRNVPGGLLFWRSTDKDLQHATEVAQRLQSAQRQQQNSRQLISHVGASKADIIRQLIIQATPEDFPKSWHMTAVERSVPSIRQKIGNNREITG
jgi:hypothetical protein